MSDCSTYLWRLYLCCAFVYLFFAEWVVLYYSIYFFTNRRRFLKEKNLIIWSNIKVVNQVWVHLILDLIFVPLPSRLIIRTSIFGPLWTVQKEALLDISHTTSVTGVMCDAYTCPLCVRPTPVRCVFDQWTYCQSG